MTTPVDWGPIDPADWEPEAPAMTEEQAALVCAIATQRVLEDKVARLKRARRLMAKAFDGVQAAAREVEVAIELVEQSAREWAKLAGGRNASR